MAQHHKIVEGLKEAVEYAKGQNAAALLEEALAACQKLRDWDRGDCDISEAASAARAVLLKAGRLT